MQDQNRSDQKRKGIRGSKRILGSTEKRNKTLARARYQQRKTQRTPENKNNKSNQRLRRRPNNHITSARYFIASFFFFSSLILSFFLLVVIASHPIYHVSLTIS